MFKNNNITTYIRFALFGAALTSAAAFADTGGLKILITDQSGKPVAGATINVSTSDSLTHKQGITNSNGIVRLVGLDPSHKYQVKVNGQGFDTLTKNHIKVVSGKSFNLSYTVGEASSIETIEVSGSRTVSSIDTSSATTGIDVTLDLTESLPTARNYQSYLQLAPGVKPSPGGNPSSKSGVNFSDAGGAVGVSTDNVYYLDGIDTTDNVNGTAGSAINSEIIQEQQIFTGGIPAEFSGGSGLVTRVVTKSGSNEFHGSVNYYMQNDGLVSKNKHLPGKKFSNFDTAFTLGGPIIQDELWFFLSYQKKSNATDVVAAKTGGFLRTVDDDTNLGFAKITWQPTDNDKFIVSYFDDPQSVSGSISPKVLKNRDSTRLFGGKNYKLQYSHSWDNAAITVMKAKHTGESSFASNDKSARSDVAYLGYSPSRADLSKGGRGLDRTSNSDREEFHITGEYFLDTENFGYHSFKAGYSNITNFNISDSRYTGERSQYTSIGKNNAGTTLGQYTDSNLSWVGQKDIGGSDYARIIKAMAKSSDSAYYLTLLDTDNNNVISDEELNALKFSDTGSNPYNDVNVYRITQESTSPVKMKVKGQSVFIQDNWSYHDFTINAGLRAEKWEHIASTGQSIATFDWDIAPRLSAVYDINGEGESKVFAFVGRYYDPIRSDMTSFAGNLTGPVRNEQVRVGNKWLTFRTRGGTKSQDAFFAPTTKTPYTDEFMLGYANNFAENMSIEVTYTKRVTKDIMEDYDLGLYAEHLKGTKYYLPYSYFGYDKNPGSNYVIATLKGGKREYQGIELSFRKFRADNWQAGASYTNNRAFGNTNSDGNADLQGDIVWLDPRAPGQWGPQPGNIPHLLKGYASYFFDNGFEIGAIYNWNSGTLYSKAASVYGRHIPLREKKAYEDGGHTTKWLQKGLLGSEQTDSYGTLDVRLKYTHDFENVKAEAFIDIFNLLDDQAGVREQALVAGSAEYKFGEETEWVEPRRLYVGVKLSF